MLLCMLYLIICNLCGAVLCSVSPGVSDSLGGNEASAQIQRGAEADGLPPKSLNPSAASPPPATGRSRRNDRQYPATAGETTEETRQ